MFGQPQTRRSAERKEDGYAEADASVQVVGAQLPSCACNQVCSRSQSIRHDWRNRSRCNLEQSRNCSRGAVACLGFPLNTYIACRVHHCLLLRARRIVKVRTSDPPKPKCKSWCPSAAHIIHVPRCCVYL